MFLESAVQPVSGLHAEAQGRQAVPRLHPEPRGEAAGVHGVGGIVRPGVGRQGQAGQVQRTAAPEHQDRHFPGQAGRPVAVREARAGRGVQADLV